MEETTDRSDTKKHSLSASHGGSKDGSKGSDWLGGTHLTGLTRYLLVALDFKSTGREKNEKRSERGAGPITYLRHSAQEISPRFLFISISLEYMPSCRMAAIGSRFSLRRSE